MAEAKQSLEVPTNMQWSFEPRLNGPQTGPYNATNLQSSTAVAPGPHGLCREKISRGSDLIAPYNPFEIHTNRATNLNIRLDQSHIKPYIRQI
jgi:hypothetical protein